MIIETVWVFTLLVARTDGSTMQFAKGFGTDVECGVAWHDWKQREGQWWTDANGRIVSISPCGETSERN